MGLRMHFLELQDRHAGVDFGGREVGMPEERLDVADVGAVLQHQSRHGVAEDMTRAALADVRLLDAGPRDLGQPIGSADRYTLKGDVPAGIADADVLLETLEQEADAEEGCSS